MIDYLKTCSRKNSIVEIIIAHAGETFNKRGTRPKKKDSIQKIMNIEVLPLYQLRMPCSLNIFRRISMVRSLVCDWLTSNRTCRIDLTVSNGCVIIVANAPELNLIKNKINEFPILPAVAPEYKALSVGPVPNFRMISTENNDKDWPSKNTNLHFNRSYADQ